MLTREQIDEVVQSACEAGEWEALEPVKDQAAQANALAAECAKMRAAAATCGLALSHGAACPALASHSPAVARVEAGVAYATLRAKYQRRFPELRSEWSDLDSALAAFLAADAACKGGPK